MGRPTIKTQPREKRVKNFNEVSLGYSKQLVLEESKRCPQCEDPVCIQGCPLGINIPGFIRSLREGKAREAYATVKEQNSLMSVCGRICTAPCEISCVLNEEESPISIRALERYTSDFGRTKPAKRNPVLSSGKKVAIVGSGPAGLTAAAELAKRGYQVTVFESFDKPGGILRYGIPEFRIPKKVLDIEINEIKALGVCFEMNALIGHTTTLEEIQREYSAVLLATGANIPKFINIPGTSSGGVYYGEEFLMRINRARSSLFSNGVPKLPLGQKIAVIGSGNTALDCARAAVRLGREAILVFRRTEEDLFVLSEDRALAKEEGIRFESMAKPIEVLSGSNHFVRGLKCARMDYADPDGSGEWTVMEVPDSEFTLDVDTVVIAIGHKPNSLLSKESPLLKVNRDGTLHSNDERGMTSVAGVFACGNVKTNAGPVVEAMASGKKAAQEIDQYLK